MLQCKTRKDYYLALVCLYLQLVESPCEINLSGELKVSLQNRNKGVTTYEIGNLYVAIDRSKFA